MTEQVVQRDHSVGSSEVSGNVVGIGNADIGRGIGCDIGDDIVIDFAVVCIQPEIDGDVGIQCFEIGDGLLINFYLGHICVIFCPERDFILPRGIEFLRYFKDLLFFGAMAGCECYQQNGDQEYGNAFSHPFIPPLETPAMIFLRKSRNRMISGREMTTTAAIIAGIFSRPKPFSRIS